MVSAEVDCYSGEQNEPEQAQEETYYGLSMHVYNCKDPELQPHKACRGFQDIALAISGISVRAFSKAAST